MALTGGFITIHRKILKWEWFSDAITFHTFMYLLLSANYEPGMFRGIRIERGQLVTSLPKIAEDCQQTIQQTRTAISHLQLTGEITDQANPHYRIITIVRYDEYQQTNRQINRQLTDNQHTDQQTNQQQWNNIINKQYNNINKTTLKSGSVPPTLEDVTAYCKERNNGIDPQRFIDYNQARGWTLKGGQKVKDWKACIRVWEGKDKADKSAKQTVKRVIAQDFEQRDYSDVPRDLMSELEKELAEFKRTGKVDI